MNNNEYLEKSEQLNALLKELSNDPQLTEERMSKYLDEFQCIYSNDFRHDYSAVTRILFSIEMERDLRDFMVSNIKDIYYKSKQLDEEKGRRRESFRTKSLKKLADHINLENIRLKELIRISNEVSTANEVAATTIKELANDKIKIADLNKKIVEAEEQMKKINSTMKNSTTESITILSIFAGVVMAFTGGFSYISQAIAALNQIGPYRAGIFITLIGMVMFDVVFLLLYMIAKLTERPIASSGKCCNPKYGCNCKSIECSVNRYPYLVWFNFIGFVIMWSVLVVYFVDSNEILELIFINITPEIIWYKLLSYFIFILGCIASYMPFVIIFNKLCGAKCKSNKIEQ